jgi:hypothetical protein
MGTLSLSERLCLQQGQKDPGLTIDRSLGNLYMMTFKKLPIQRPKRQMIVGYKYSMLTPHEK